MGEYSALAELIRKARGRHAFHIFIEQLLFAASIALGGIVVLLLVGSQVLNGIWIGILFAISLGIGLYRAKQRFRAPYQLAQALDQRLNLHDSLSTALYFGEHPSGDGIRRALVERQRDTAEQAARSVDLKTGLPFQMPRSLYVASGLLLVAASVFAVRYGVTHSLDLRGGLVQIAFSGLLGTEDVASAKKKGTTPNQPGTARPVEDALTVDPWESKVLDSQGAPDSALNTVDTPDVNNKSVDTPNAKSEGAKTGDPEQQAGEGGENSEKSQAGEQNSENASASSKEGKQAKQQAGDQQDKQGNSSSGENSSLADKMRDALSNLMSKMKQQKPNDGNKGSPQSQQGQQTAQKQGKDDKGSPQGGKQQSDAMSSPDQQGDQEGQSSDKAASAQNKSGSKSDKPPTQDGKSGVGKEDGDKSSREAEQLAAMGKISEIIGKRAQNMTGEVMVEVSSGKQQLKTQYSQRRAAHADAGSEINRDEVPLAYQQFVQQYFEEIRKAPASANPATPQPPTAPKAKKTTGS